MKRFKKNRTRIFLNGMEKIEMIKIIYDQTFENKEIKYYF
jgi:hypothetical protein